LIFGGYGNESGKQELSPESLYDLYSLDLKNYSFKKLWELTNVDVSFALSNSLIADSAKDCFYALCYPVHKYTGKLYLARFGISNPDMTVISDSIPYLFQDTESFCDLFFNAPTKELIAITSSYLENNLSGVSIYSLSFPPVQPGISQSKMLSPGSKKQILIFFYILIILLVGATVSLLYKKLRIFKLTGNKDLKPLIIPDNVLNRDDIKNIHTSETGVKVNVVRSQNIPKCTIRFLGGFQVIGNNNHEITGLFTPTLKQLFVMILLSSGESGKGVASEQLRDHIWFKKSKESARNIRGVYIRKLRMILDDISDVQLINSNGYWTIQVGAGVDYDYGIVMDLLHNIRHNEGIGQDSFSELVLLGSKGTLLPNMENEWLDKYKADYSSEIIDVLLDISKRIDFQKDIKLIIQIADAIFSNDPLNEDALRLKCKVLNDNGKHSLAKSVFESFTRDYSISMGSDFDRSFNDMII
jgi:two-component SAPR family response regulator